MNDDDFWELARKPVTEFVEAIKEMDLNVNQLVEFYLKHRDPAIDSDQQQGHANQDKFPILSPLACAKLELAIVFAINTCYWMYLVTHGENPSKNEISKDIERVRLFMNRAKEVEKLSESCSSAKRPKVGKI